MASTNPNLLLDSTKTRSIDKIEYQYNHFAKTIKISKRKEICTANINYEQSIDFNTPQIVPM